MEDVTRDGLDRPWVGAKALNGAFAEGGGGGGIDGRRGEAADEGGQIDSNSYDDAEAAAASVASAVRVEDPRRGSVRVVRMKTTMRRRRRRCFGRYPRRPSARRTQGGSSGERIRLTLTI